MSEQQETKEASTFSQKWTRALQAFTKPMLKPILVMSNHAARNPKTYIVSIIILSFGLMVLGFATNFNEDTSDDIWSPQGSKPVVHNEWIEDDSNFPKDTRDAVIIIHRDGKNLFGDDGSLAFESTKRMFAALDHFRETPRYNELCTYSKYTNPATNQTDCQISGATTFWNDSTETWRQSAVSNEAVLTTMSSETYPYGSEVDFDAIIGYNRFDNSNILNYGETFLIAVRLPADEDDSDAFSEDFEEDAIDRMLELQDQWEAEDGNDFKVEIFAERSFEDEFARAVTDDLLLIPLVFMLMSILCVILFAKKDKVLSRTWLGFGAVVTVMLAIVASFGFLFLVGVPFTSLTPLLPFIFFGVGLDDAFIISGAFARTDSSKTPEDRIQDTMEDIGSTILLTTLTSSLAFALGAVSSIPAVKYLVMYAWPTIIIDFIFQITFFVAIIVIDQRRIDENRRDWCFCCKANEESNEADTQKSEAHFADRLMARYADFLLKPAVRYAVLAIFAGLLGLFSWRTSQMTQHFDFTDVIPGDSYIQTWWDTFNDHYESNGVLAQVYFRDVDFSSVEIQDQMEAYVTELANMPYAGEDEPFEFWLRDFKVFVEEKSLDALSFEEQIQEFLEDPINFENYNEDIVLNEDGVMTASRTLIRLDNVDSQDVLDTVDALELQRSISKSQPINQGKSDWSFFMFSEDFLIWEFYKVSPDEVRLTAIVGTVSVAFLALVFIPHWSAILFVGPMAMVLYIDLLGFMEICGIRVNPVMYISTVMSIGLMVDFLMHIVLRFFETVGTTREEKTKATLETIGASVLVGGFSTLIGVLPLALSQSEIFWTTFVIFFGLILLGLLHGLVLLPVLLSLFGPLESIVEESDRSKHLGREETAGSDTNDTNKDNHA